MPAPVIAWFRRDLRLASNPALEAAAAAGPVIAVFIRETDLPPGHEPGGAVRWWLHHSLAALAARLARRGVPLVLRTGPAATELARLARETGATRVFFNRVYEPALLKRDERIAESLADADVAIKGHNGSLLYEPWAIRNQAGKPYKVFSQFYKRGCLGSGLEPPATTGAAKLHGAKPAPVGESLADWGWHPTGPDWSAGLAARWVPGEAGAAERLDTFVDDGLAGYASGRDFPGRSSVSGLSAHLQHGEIAPWQVRDAVLSAASGDRRIAGEDVESFLRELGWREFSHHLLYHFPTLPTDNWRRAFDAFPWRNDPTGLTAWQLGRTGYPFVDAGMRELWQTGYMHGRVRMVTASFLVKHLRVDWRHGEAWFRDTLVDASVAQNNANWQWVAGSGADAAPYFRIFNPIVQGEKFDRDGDYVRRWVPELARVERKFLHRPFDADPARLALAGVTLGDDYPQPLVDHAAARAEALAAFEAVKAAGRG